MARCSASVKPEVTKSCGAPASSMVAMAPKRAPVSDRALSTTSRSTVSRSRLALIRRLAVLSAEMRSRSASFLRLRSRSVIRSSLHPLRAALPARPGTGSPTGPGCSDSARFLVDRVEFAKNSCRIRAYYPKNGH